MTISGPWGGGTSTTPDVAPESAPLTAVDRERLSSVEGSLQTGRELKVWWDALTADLHQPPDIQTAQEWVDAGYLKRSFPLTRVGDHWPHDISYGFYDQLPATGLDVIGCFQQFFYDQPTLRLREALERVDGVDNAAIAEADAQALGNWRDNVREFALNTYINATSYVPPSPPTHPGRGPLADYLHPFSWCAEGKRARVGISNRQVYYKRRDTGQVGKFWPVDAYPIRLWTIGDQYAWIVIEIEVSDANLDLRLDDELPALSVPIVQKQFGVICPEFVVSHEAAPGGLSRFGFSYALLKHAQRDTDGVPPPSDVGLHETHFCLADDGQILVQNALIMERQKHVTLWNANPAGTAIRLADRMTLGVFSRLLTPLANATARVPLVGQFDPMLAYATMANLATGGFAGRQLCVHRDQLERRFLLSHYQEQFEAVLGTRGIWRHERDWANPTHAPSSLTPPANPSHAQADEPRQEST